MNLKLNLKKIEKTCIVLSFIFVLLLSLLGIIAIADGLFKWDILPDNLQKIATLAMLTMGVVVFSSFLISLMINLSRISANLESIAENMDELKK